MKQRDRKGKLIFGIAFVVILMSLLPSISAQTTVSPGIMPNSPFYGLDVALDEIIYLISGRSSVIGLRIARERIAEARAMNNLGNVVGRERAIIEFQKWNKEKVNKEICIQLITPAMNPNTKECKNFPTPCDVSEGWLIVEDCANKEVIPTPKVPDDELKEEWIKLKEEIVDFVELSRVIPEEIERVQGKECETARDCIGEIHIWTVGEWQCLPAYGGSKICVWVEKEPIEPKPIGRNCWHLTSENKCVFLEDSKMCGMEDTYSTLGECQSALEPEKPGEASEGECCLSMSCSEGLICASPCFCENGKLVCAYTKICMKPENKITSCEITEEKKEEARKRLCPEVYDPVCGQDGKTYSNSCFAELAGVYIKCDGKCPCEVGVWPKYRTPPTDSYYTFIIQE